MREDSDEDGRRPAKKLGVNALPKEGFSLVIDGKFKTHYAHAPTRRRQVALKLKTRPPRLQIMIRDDADGRANGSLSRARRWCRERTH